VLHPVPSVQQAQAMTAGGSSSLPMGRSTLSSQISLDFSRNKVYDHLAQPREEHLVAPGNAQSMSSFSYQTG